MDLDEIRHLTIIALFADDRLMNQIVLKGGSALNLIYQLSSRTSADLDFSIDQDFEDIAEIGRRIFRSLKDRFDSAGYIVFDERLEPKPRLDHPDESPWWGGYELSFKLIEKGSHLETKGNLKAMRKRAIPVTANSKRTFTVDLSKYEYVAGKVAIDFDNYKIFVYSPEMLVIEKLRAICQQMAEYPPKGHPRPRARDFYDIHATVTRVGIKLDSEENLQLVRRIFEAKRVPLRLLSLISREREFHRPDWPAVLSSVEGSLEEFDFYFDFTLNEVGRLKTLWEEDSPV
jgi:predicted nucleotidyltransferase component of viral defense system